MNEQQQLWNDLFTYYDKEYLNQPYRPLDEFITMLAAKYTIYTTGTDVVHIPRAQVEKLLEEIIMLNAANAELEELRNAFIDSNPY